MISPDVRLHSPPNDPLRDTMEDIMRTLSTIALLLVAATAWAQQPAATPEQSTRDKARAVNADVAGQGQPSVPNNQWRYKWHDGRWWYWQTNNSWVIWEGNAWIPQSALNYSAGYRGYYGSRNRGGYGPGAYYYGRNYYGPGYYGYAPGFYGQGYGNVPGYNPGAARGAYIGGAIGGAQGAGAGAVIGGAISR
ncbi:MAG: hypothetical protein AB7O59_23375 [Pirellulales bacterium]